MQLLPAQYPLSEVVGSLPYLCPEPPVRPLTVAHSGALSGGVPGVLSGPQLVGILEGDIFRTAIIFSALFTASSRWTVRSIDKSQSFRSGVGSHIIS